VFFTWVRETAAAILALLLPEALQREVLGSGLAALRVIYLALRPETGSTRWLNGRSWDAVARRALARAVQRLRQRFGPDPAAWTWGRAHQQRFTHVLGDSHGRPPVSRRGGLHTVDNAGFSLAQDDFAPGGGPCARVCFEVAPDWPRAESVIPGAQGGEPTGPDGTWPGDQLPLWLANRCKPLPFTEAQVAAATVRSVQLLPMSHQTPPQTDC
jgi:penicillin amidase